MNGLILFNKNKNYTSRDVDNILKGILHQKKIGHAGTLDPNATGLLLCLLGRATSYQDFFEGNKTYIAEIIFGLKTTSEDITGEILEENFNFNNLNDEILNQILNSFLGDYEQIPPMFSAKHYNGKRLYDLAYEGKVVERKANKVHIFNIKKLDNIKNYKNTKYKCCNIEITCSKGTYIRSLCRDIGEKLKINSIMGELKRIKIDEFNINDSYTKEDIEYKIKNNDFSFIRPCFYLKNPSVVTFGKFDVIHIGHQLIFDKMREISIKEKLDTACIVFYMDKEDNLYDINERYNYIKNYGINNIFRTEFGDEIKNLSAPDFIDEVLIKQMKAKHIIVGEDVSFGKNRTGDAKFLVDYLKNKNIKVHILDKKSTIYNDKVQDISSTFIKYLIKIGDFDKINELLNRKLNIDKINK